MQQRSVLGLCLLLLCLGRSTAQSATADTTCDPSKGLCFNREAFQRNLRYLSSKVLPEGWKLNAVVKVSR
jgi:hypothetical protein